MAHNKNMTKVGLQSQIVKKEGKEMGLKDGNVTATETYGRSGYPEEIPAIWDRDSDIDRLLQKKRKKLKRLKKKLRKGKGDTKKRRRKIRTLKKRCRKLEMKQEKQKMNDREQMFELQMAYREQLAQARLEAFFYKQALTANGRGDLDISKLLGTSEKIYSKKEEK